MRTTLSVAAAIAMFIMSTILVAQPRFPQGRQDRTGPGAERLERFKRMRLVEVLKLNEEDAVRFFAKQSAHEEKVHELMKSRNEALGRMKDMLQEKKITPDLRKDVEVVLELDQKIFTERRRYQDDVRKLLTEEQFAKFLVFEQNFGRQMRDALDEMRKGRRDRGDE